MTTATVDNLISITEIIGSIHSGTMEVCASADAEYDPEAKAVAVSLSACTRRASASGRGEQLSERWLPPNERVTEQLPRNDANAFTKEIFGGWARKVRASIPRNLRSIS